MTRGASDDRARRAFEPLVRAARGNARALLALAGDAIRAGDFERSEGLVRQAAEAEPNNLEISAFVRSLRSSIVPLWHFPMMRDEARNRAFEAAIIEAVKPGMRVLDIGSGSGLLAMMAARAGAEHVHSCEMNPAIADAAREIVRNNGFSNRITIHAKPSQRLDPERDLGGRADVVVAEIIGRDFVCEKVLPTMRDAARRLAKPNAQFIPQSGELRVALAHYGRLHDVSIGTVCGFDLSAFNRFTPGRLNIWASDRALTISGKPATLFRFDFGSSKEPRIRSAANPIATGGKVNGVLQWFRLSMDEAECFENAPGSPSSRSWSLGFHPFAREVELEAGATVSIEASVAHNRLEIWRT